MCNRPTLLHRKIPGNLKIKVWLQNGFPFQITWIIGIICSTWIHNSLHIILTINGIPLNLWCKILTPGTLGHSHQTNKILGLLDGGTSIQGTSFPISNLLNSFHIKCFLINCTLLNNILSFINSISSPSCNSRIMLSLICRYDHSCLLNLTPNQIIKNSISLRLPTCPLTPLLLYPKMTSAYDQGG